MVLTSYHAGGGIVHTQSTLRSSVPGDGRDEAAHPPKVDILRTVGGTPNRTFVAYGG